MKEFLVKKALYDDKNDMKLFANPGDYIILMPDNRTFLFNNGSTQRTMVVLDIEKWIEAGYIVEVFNSATDPNISIPDKARADMVNHPSHYNWLKEKCGVEPQDIMRHLNSNMGQVVKYVLRAGHKSEQGLDDKEKHIEDLEKALFYLKDEIKMLKKS